MEIKSKFFLIIKSLRTELSNFLLLLCVSSLFIYFSSSHPYCRLESNPALYLFSASAQVLAAVYALTLTGFTFFKSIIEKDDSLEGIAELMIQKSFYKLIYISIMTFFSIVFCLLTMASQEISIYQLLVNITIVFSVNDLYLIISFVINVINPKWAEKISNKIVRKTGAPKVDLIPQFLALFQKIEQVLEKASKSYIYDNPHKFSRKKLATTLLQRELISPTLLGKLSELIAFRNSLIHISIEQGVPENMITTAKEVLAELKQSLQNEKNLINFDWEIKV